MQESVRIMVHDSECTLLGMVMGMQESVRIMVRMGSTRSTVPTTNLLPPTELISMRSPTTKGREMNCKAQSQA